jgi:hypothetical protein
LRLAVGCWRYARECGADYFAKAGARLPHSKWVDGEEIVLRLCVKIFNRCGRAFVINKCGCKF